MKAALIDKQSTTEEISSDVKTSKPDFLDKAAILGKEADNRLRVAEIPDPVAGPDELLVRIESISVEGGDLMARRLGISGPNGVLGYCAAGEIITVGENVQGFKVGQKVATFAGAGSHATLRAAPAATCFIVPEGLDLGVAAAIPVVGGTAERAMEIANVGKGDTVLVTGAAGGLGIAVIQLAARRGARVIATGTNTTTLEKTKEYGATDIINAKSQPINEQVRELLGGNGVTVLIDTICGPVLEDAIDTMADHGNVVLLGAFGGFDQKLDAGQLLLRQLTVSGCAFGEQMGKPENVKMINELLQLASEGKFAVPIDQVFPFDEIDAAHTRAEQRGRLGRVIVKV